MALQRDAYIQSKLTRDLGKEPQTDESKQESTRWIPSLKPTQQSENTVLDTGWEEFVTVVERFSFNVGMAIKYLWQSRTSGFEIQDLEAAERFIRREIKLRKRELG